jgi:MFS family permease
MQTETTAHSGPLVIPPGKGLLINRNFTLLAIGQAISNLGDFVYSTTLLVWVYALNHTAMAVSGVMLAQYAPIFLLGPIAGVFVDRWNRRSTMMISDLARAAIAILPLLVPSAVRLPTIYASVFLLSFCSRFFTPARSGILQAIVAPEQQGQAAAVGQATFALSIVIGPTLATPLYFLLGPTIAISINAISFVVSALCVALIRAPRELLHPYAFQREQAEAKGLRAIGNELVSGLHFVLTTRILLMVTVMALIAMLGSGALNALDIIFVSQRLHISTAYYGPLVAVGGAGTLLGAIVAGLLVRKIRPQRILTGSIILIGLGFILYALQTHYIVALIVIFFAMIPQGGIDVGFAPLLINTTPAAIIGRVMSVFETCMYGMSLLSAALAGYLGQLYPVYLILATSGIILTLSGIFGWFAIPNTVAELSQNTR